MPEYGNPEITHNVEYSLHPVLRKHNLILRPPQYPVTASRILAETEEQIGLKGFQKSSLTLVTTDGVLRNGCTVATGEQSRLSAALSLKSARELQVAVFEQHAKPFAIFECKRVGVEEGTRKGPQTIEKAKQGAYVAKIVSSLHKIRAATDPELMRDFILTVGVVSNHGNWFTSDDHNKELKVLAQSYDWLVFLTDDGLPEFITELLLKPLPLLRPARVAFLASYTAQKKRNRFTKVQMNYKADRVLQTYFRDNLPRIEKWFNVIAPKHGSMQKLRSQISHLRDKDWRAIHSL